MANTPQSKTIPPAKAIAFEMRLAEETSSNTHLLEFSKSEIVIGRSENSDIQLPDSSVSIVHAKIFSRNGSTPNSPATWAIQDLHSTNGTALNGVKVERGKAIELPLGSTIYIGRFCLNYIDPSVSKNKARDPKNEEIASKTYDSTASLARALMHEMSEKIAGAKKRIFIENCARFPDAIVIGKNQSIVLGRDVECNITIDDPDLSRKHIQLSDQAKGLQISDLNSKNGTYVNDIQLSGPMILAHDDRVRIGRTEFRFAEANLELLEELQQPLRYTNYAIDDGIPTDIISSPRINKAALDMQVGAEKAGSQKKKTQQRSKDTSREIDWLFIIPAIILVSTAVATIIYLAR